MLQFTGKDDLNITNQPVVIPNGVSEACFQLVAVDDGVVESNETFTLVVEATNSNDMVEENTTVVISDNDRKNITVHIMLSESPRSLCTGVNLRLNESVLITEGGMQNICVTVSDHEQSHERERDIYISFSAVAISNTSCKCVTNIHNSLVYCIPYTCSCE